MVQGVGFRYFVYGKAKGLGITGYVRNLDNGSVEIVAEGERSLLEALIRELNAGPRLARVTDVKIAWISPQHRYKEFLIE
jgi:acylphosphatase